MKDFTADDARLLVKNKTKMDHVDFLVCKIKEAAEKGQLSVIVRDEPYAQCIRLHTFISDNEVIGAVNHLRASGFSIKQYWKELQFVDMGLEISWRDN